MGFVMVLEKEHFNTFHFFLLFLPQPKEYTATLLVNLHGPTHLNSTEEEMFLSPSPKSIINIYIF